MGNTKQVTESIAAFGWPPLMRMEIACRYTCRSRWTLQRAVQSGELVAAGKQRRSLTFRWIARAANVADIVTRAISGHATPEMQRHYSTVSGDEMRAGLAKVIDIATGRERSAA